MTDSRAKVAATGSSPVTRPLYAFTASIFTALNKNREGNLVVSPISIHKALNMVLLGATNDSQTKRELLEAIGYANLNASEIEQVHRGYAEILKEFEAVTMDTLDKRQKHEQKLKEDGEPHPFSYAAIKPREPIMELFNMMVVKNKGQVNPSYERDIREYYDASIWPLEDAKRETKTELIKKLNDWGKKAEFTDPIMKEADLDEKFAAILISAIRIEAFWFSAFDELEGDKVFYNYGLEKEPVAGKKLKHGHVYGRVAEFTNANTDGALPVSFRAVEIPLVGDLSFTIFEPTMGFNAPAEGHRRNSNLKRLIAHLFSSANNNTKTPTMTNLDRTLRELANSSTRELDVTLPKFKLENELKLVGSLRALGIERAFNERSAEITQMTTDPLFISDVKHLAMIDVTENGIKAAALTVISMSITIALRPPPREISVEHPFVFLFRYKELPLFIGQLTNLKK